MQASCHAVLTQKDDGVCNCFDGRCVKSWILPKTRCVELRKINTGYGRHPTRMLASCLFKISYALGGAKRMKKAVAIIIAVLMVFSLFACGGTKTTTSPAATAVPQRPHQPRPQPSPGVRGASPSAAHRQERRHRANANEIGYFETGVAPASRKHTRLFGPYAADGAVPEHQQCPGRNGAEAQLQTTAYCANSDIDALIQNIQIYADQSRRFFCRH